MSFFRLVPNLTIIAPKDFKELEEILEFAISLNSPVVIRYPRGGESEIKMIKQDKVELGKCEILQYGKDITILAIGKMVSKALEVSEKLKTFEINTEVINARFLKPFDVESIVESIKKNKNVITIEDGTSINGLGTAVKELIIEKKLKNIKFKSFAYPDKYIEHGEVDELEKIYELDVDKIVSDIRKDYDG